MTNCLLWHISLRTSLRFGTFGRCRPIFLCPWLSVVNRTEPSLAMDDIFGDDCVVVVVVVADADVDSPPPSPPLLTTPEAALEGTLEGTLEGALEGILEAVLEGRLERALEGALEAAPEVAPAATLAEVGPPPPPTAAKGAAGGAETTLEGAAETTAEAEEEEVVAEEAAEEEEEKPPGTVEDEREEEAELVFANSGTILFSTRSTRAGWTTNLRDFERGPRRIIIFSTFLLFLSALHEKPEKWKER